MKPRSVSTGLILLSTLGVAGLGLGAMSTDAVPGPEVASLAELAGRLAECEARAPCTHMVYVRSPAMPLSERGVPEIVEATRSLGVPLSILPAHTLFEPEAQRLLDELRMALVEAGATVHFPAVVVVNDGAPVGNAVVGYKPAEVYESVLGRRLAPAAPTAPAVGDVPTRDVELLAAYPLPSRPGAFFRRAPGTRYISFDLESVVYLHHLESNERFSAPGQLDFVPSPDGAFFVTPGARYAGLQFYSAREIFRLGARNQARALALLLVDETLRDEYPSIGILGREADGGASATECSLPGVRGRNTETTSSRSTGPARSPASGPSAGRRAHARTYNSHCPSFPRTVARCRPGTKAPAPRRYSASAQTGRVGKWSTRRCRLRRPRSATTANCSRSDPGTDSERSSETPGRPSTWWTDVPARRSASPKARPGA